MFFSLLGQKHCSVKNTARSKTLLGQKHCSVENPVPASNEQDRVLADGEQGHKQANGDAQPAS
jgi:hypothetical protein